SHHTRAILIGARDPLGCLTPYGPEPMGQCRRRLFPGRRRVAGAGASVAFPVHAAPHRSYRLAEIAWSGLRVILEKRSATGTGSLGPRPGNEATDRATSSA